jgi:hypothetical protein
MGDAQYLPMARVRHIGAMRRVMLLEREFAAHEREVGIDEPETA